MESADIIKTIIWLTLVIVSFLMLAFFFQRFHKKLSPLGKNLSIKGTLALDTKRRLVMVEHNSENFLLFLGPHNDFVISHSPHSVCKTHFQGNPHEASSTL